MAESDEPNDTRCVFLLNSFSGFYSILIESVDSWQTNEKSVETINDTINFKQLLLFAREQY